MKAIFTDTSYWIALVNPADEFHARARGLATALRGPFMTTQWVLAEFLDGYCSAQLRQQAMQFVEALTRQESLTIVPASDEDFRRGLERFRLRPDKEWSLTDCISFGRGGMGNGRSPHC